MKKVLIRMAAITLLAAAVLACVPYVQAASKTYNRKSLRTGAVSASSYTARTTLNLRMRSSKSTTANNILLVIPKNKVVIIRSREANNWYGILYNGKAGYVKGGYLTDNTDRMKTTANLRLRTSMDQTVTNNIIRTMPKFSVVEVITRYKNGWYLVNYKGKSGYASAKYLVDTDEQQKVIKVTTAKLRLRSSMSAKTDANIILIIPKGNKVELLSEQENGWVKVKYGSRIGYVMSQYLKNSKKEASSNGVVKIMAENLNVRSSMSKASDSNIIGLVKKGTSVTILSKESNNWYKIKYGSGVGYIRGGHFTDDTSRVGIG